MNASDQIDGLIVKLTDWRGQTLADIRKIIHEANPEMVEERKWMGTPVWSHRGIVCLADAFKDKVKVTFHNGASLADPDGLFNNGLGSNKWRSTDFFEGDQIMERQLKDLVRSTIAFNLTKKTVK